MLVSLALVNPSENEPTKQIEEEIVKVRKDGGLEESEEARDDVEGDVVEEEE